MTIRRVTILALDLEGTLISNAMSQIPRPDLHAFLVGCRELFERVVIFTAVSESTFRPIARKLVEECVAPEWFSEVEFVHWTGPTKDLSFIPNADVEEAILVDDYESYVHPGQQSQWVPISLFDYQSNSEDDGLVETLRRLRAIARR